MHEAERLAQLVADFDPGACELGVAVEPLDADQLGEVESLVLVGLVSDRDSDPTRTASAIGLPSVALTDDQKAMLRLLAQREQGYDDIAALTGQGVAAVRAKVKDAIAALDGPEPPADDQKAMLRLLAQREEGYGRHRRSDRPETSRECAPRSARRWPSCEGTPTSSLRRDSPTIGTRASRASRRGHRRAETDANGTTRSQSAQIAKRSAAGAWQKTRSAPRLKLPDDRGAVWGLGAGLAVILVLVILLATGALGGGGSESGSTSSATEATGTGTSGTDQSGESANASNELQPTQAVLKPVGASKASGRALFGRSKKQVVLLVKADGLDPSPQGKSYTVSLAKSPTERLPLVATQVSKSGKLEGTFQVAPQVLGLLASGFDEMEISLVSNGALGTALKAAKRPKRRPITPGSPCSADRSPARSSKPVNRARSSLRAKACRGS